MQPDERDAASLWDMLEAARTISVYVSGRTYADFQSSHLLQDAVIRQLTIPGEAAGRISEATRRELPEIPWQTVVGMRNVVVHQYDKVILERVWIALDEDLPDLARALLRATSRLEMPDEDQETAREGDSITDDPGDR
jgi:uncharacterized protein with HEPN domain